MNEKFFESVRQGDTDAVERSLKRNRKLVRARDANGLSPVMVAAYAHHFKLAEALAARAAAEPDGIDLFEAATVGDVRSLRRRLDEGCKVSERSADGFTPLHLAAYFGRLSAARLLLDRGADANAVASNDSRVTPLHSAVAGQHRDVASLLLIAGAAANAVQQGGFTPLHSAAQNGDDALADLLLIREADPVRANDDGRTPIDLAEESGHGALAEVLREASKR